MKKDCLKEIRFPNCQQDYPAYSRSCERKEILEVKHKRNITSLKARKIVGSYMGENTYTSVAWRLDPINQNNKYRALVEKLIQLKLNDWPVLGAPEKKVYSAEFQQAQTQQEVTNKEKSNETRKNT